MEKVGKVTCQSRRILILAEELVEMGRARMVMGTSSCLSMQLPHIRSVMINVIVQRKVEQCMSQSLLNFSFMKIVHDVCSPFGGRAFYAVDLPDVYISQKMPAPVQT
jgi:hypothetical protein